MYGLAGHAGDWRKGQTDWQAYRLNQPLIAFEASKHAGALGKTFSLLSVSNSRVRVLALKKAEQSDEVIVRLVELDGKPASGVQIAFAAPITAAREVNGAEEPVGAATVTGWQAGDFVHRVPAAHVCGEARRRAREGRGGAFAAGEAGLRPGRRQQR